MEIGDRIYILKQLYENSAIPCGLYRRDGMLLFDCAEQNYANAIASDPELLENIIAVCGDSDVPVIYIERLNIFWGILKMKDDSFMIWGPASMVKVENNIVAYRHIHGIEDNHYFIVVSSIERMSNILSIANFAESGDKLESQDIFIYWNGVKQKQDIRELEEYQLEKSETGRISTSVQYEEKFVKIVETGDIAAMKRLMQVNALSFDGMGQVAEKITKKMEYLCVSSVVLVSRAAIRGGMNASMAYDLSDIYLKKLEKCRTVEEMGFVCTKMQMDFTERVHEAKEEGRGNLFVEKAKDYVAANLRRSFQIQEMAEQLHVNRTYLSKVFRKEKGITLHQYIVKKRCEHAANMLRYTDYSLSIISEYFCFTNQSHFGQKFKEIYGMTPNEYRKRNYQGDGTFFS